MINSPIGQIHLRAPTEAEAIARANAPAHASASKAANRKLGFCRTTATSCCTSSPAKVENFMTSNISGGMLL